MTKRQKWSYVKILVQVKMRNFSPILTCRKAQPPYVFFRIPVQIHLVTYSCNDYEYVLYYKKLQVFENQPICLLIIADFKSVQPFTFDNRMKGLMHALSHGKAFFE